MFQTHLREKSCVFNTFILWQAMDELDLDMLAPYISMDDDFQLTFLPQSEMAASSEMLTNTSRKR